MIFFPPSFYVIAIAVFLLTGCEAKLHIESEPAKKEPEKVLVSPKIGTTSNAPIIAKSYTTSFGRPIYRLLVRPSYLLYNTEIEVNAETWQTAKIGQQIRIRTIDVFGGAE